MRSASMAGCGAGALVIARGVGGARCVDALEEAALSVVVVGDEDWVCWWRWGGLGLG